MLDDKVCVVTGASSGIGRATAFGLAELGSTVLLVVRDKHKGDSVAEAIRSRTKKDSARVFVADLSLQKDVRRVAAEIAAHCPRIDVLVNNAGGIFDKKILTADGIEMTIALNHLGYFLLTNLLLEKLKCAPAARIVNMSSDAHMFARTGAIELDDGRPYNAMERYATSKLLNVLFTYELGRRLEGTNVAVNAMHPGAVRSNFGKQLSG
ncbi:MAG TPA: SDR family NAD(P)-dependent oxidoreductase, partial [Bacteroidota bacterium]|nr:SDR family NAD(P)-dependent oxidoreductase [Bacteroidota bacterium]